MNNHQPQVQVKMNGRVRRAVGLGFCLLLIAGCATGVATMPEWVLNPPADTAGKIYGVGEGNTLRAANDDALGIIAGKLQTQVTADVQTETRLRNGKETSTTRNRVQTTTETLELSDFQVEKSAMLGPKRVVLLALDRQQLLRTLRSELATLDKSLRELVSDSETSGPVMRLYRLTQAQAKVGEALSLVSLIQSVASTEDLSAESAFYNGLLNEREALTRSIRLGVESGNNTDVLADRIVTLFLEDGIQAENAKAGRKYSGVIRLSGAEKKAEMFGEDHVQLSVRVELIGQEQVPISNARFEAGASSLSGYDAAGASANRLIAQKMADQGVWKALGME